MKKNNFFRGMTAFAVTAALLTLAALFLAGCPNETTDSGPVTESPTSPPEAAVPGADLAKKLAWLKENAQSDSTYLLTIDKAETLVGVVDNSSINYLYYPTKGNITIRLTGEWINHSNARDPIFAIGGGVTLILDKITLNGGVVQVASGGALEMVTGARITGWKIYPNGVSLSGNVGVRMNGGTFTMNGGEISGDLGTGVQMYGGTFTMNGGEISDNLGTGVHMNGGTFTMNGGKISGNVYIDGLGKRGVGGVYVGYGTFTMNDGEISGNNDSGVAVSGGTFTMNDGKISGNTFYTKAFEFGGGGVRVSRNGTFTKTGGTITGYGDDTQNGNVVKNESGVVQSNMGHAVYVDSIFKCRETTAGPKVALDSTKFGAAGGWDDITSTPLTANTWADGSITTSGMQLFKFTATASAQYIHFSPGTPTVVLVQVYDLSGATVGNAQSLSLYSSNTNTYIDSVMVGQEYYIMVRPDPNISSGGIYKIAFNEGLYMEEL